MAYFRCGGGSSGTDALHTVRLTESAYEALASKSNDTVYLVTNLDDNMIIKIYQGERRILNHLPEGELDDWEFWFEDLVFVQRFLSTGEVGLDNLIQIFLAENAGRDFEIRLAASPESGQNNYILTDPAENYSFRINHTNYPNQIISHGEFNMSGTNNVWLNYTYGTEFRYVRESGVIKIYSGGTMIDSWQARSYTVNSYCQIGYLSSYVFYGNVDYIGFKWLS